MFSAVLFRVGTTKLSFKEKQLNIEPVYSLKIYTLKKLIKSI